MVDIAKAAARRRRAVHDEAPDNVCYDWGHRRQGRRSTRRSPSAAHVTKLDLVNNRLIPNAMEPRAADRRSYDRGTTTSYTLYVTNQNPHVERLLMAAFVLGMPEHKLRVIAPDVGGGFGSKIFLYAEETALVWAAQAARPADQVDGRAQRGLPDRRARPRPRDHGRAGAGQGRQVPRAARATPWPTWAPTCRPSRRACRPSCTPRCWPASTRRRTIYCEREGGVHQHRAGRRLPRRRPARGTYVLERIVDTAARELRHRPGRDPPAATSSPTFPYPTPVGLNYDTGNYDAHARQGASSWPTWPASRRARRPAAAKGKLRGIGYSCYIEACGIAPSQHRRRAGRARRPVRGRRGAGAPDRQRSRCSPARTATARATRPPSRRWWPTSWASRWRTSRSCTATPAEMPVRHGHLRLRSLAVGGTAIVKAVDKIIAKGKKIAAHLLEAAEADIEFEDGKFKVAGTDKTVPFGAGRAHRLRAAQLPAGQAGAGPGRERLLRPDQLHLPRRHLHLRGRGRPRHRQGRRSCRFTAVDDFGNIINPMIVEGQVHGGMAQGIGQALLEGCVYDNETGQLLTGSLHGLRHAARRRPAELQGRPHASRPARTTRWA